MLSDILKQMKSAFILLLLFTLLTGLVYPLVVTAIAQLCFPWQANGSLIKQNGNIIGSAHIGQTFTSDGYFWGRPSATTPFPYNATHSSGSNLGPLNPTLLSNIQERIAKLHQADKQNQYLIPVDLVTASGSGLDPDISPLAAFYQVHRVAKARHLSDMQLQLLISHTITNCSLSMLGEPRVNVLQLNIALDALSAKANNKGH